MLEFHLADALATRVLGGHLGRLLPLGTVVLLTGDLGAGKTTLAQGVAQGLGVDDPVGSPTFTLLAEYPGTRGTLFHADLYRLKGEADVESTGLPEYVDRTDGLLLVEWPDRWPYWPDQAVRVTIRHDAGGRRLALRGPEMLESLLGQVDDAARD
ncbi:MAG: tRNA (adenosine(37)-N6)-threonylcarbamoyltransferase complex ATPase subunit type 1 TsaE [Candidatus Sericytochromatia bacterium]|nr:tRNA (adenosine(37)-N6)-threonylcarbamoyltransferase complex ATPase subunit type 1 TsaE [Candidatus Sericytochromatia bacterium]